MLCKRAPHRCMYPNFWDAIGGHCEPSETPVEALRRELREELGIEILEFKLLKHFVETGQFSYHLYLVHR
ncbi:MAG: NUDIX domain-containing protein [Hymenobacter sp.]|nr:NUDIX domain-containing protein [Hymenobacter sp.]